MNILIFNEFYTPHITGGAEISTQVLAETLVDMGHNVTVCTSAKKDHEDIINGVKVYYVSLNPLYWAYKVGSVSMVRKILWHTVDLYNIFGIAKVKRIIKTCKPDIINTSGLSHFSCAVWKTAHQMNIPICHTLRDFYLMCLKCTLFNGRECSTRCSACKLFSEPKRFLSGYVDGVVGISKFILTKHTENGYFRDDCFKKVIYNPIRTIKIERNHKTCRIGYIGSLIPSKGIEQLIDSFENINDPKMSLIIAGEGKDSSFVERLKSKSKGYNITFMGRMKPAEFFTQVDLLVVPSLWNEPFGRVVVESVNYSVPVIATRKGGIAEILDGRTEGRLYDPSDSNNLTNLLRDYSLGKLIFDFSNVETFSRKYSEQTCAESYLAFYKEIIQTKNENK